MFQVFEGRLKPKNASSTATEVAWLPRPEGLPRECVLSALAAGARIIEVFESPHFKDYLLVESAASRRIPTGIFMALVRRQEIERIDARCWRISAVGKQRVMREMHP